MGHCNIIALLARKIARTTTRVVIGEASLLSISTARAHLFRSRLIPFAAKWLYPRAHEIIAVSEGVADDLSRLLHVPRSRIEVIYNPVVTPALYEKVACRLEHPWFQSDAPPVILGVGRLDPEKDFTTLLRAFSVVRKNRNVRLMILGEGPERSLLNSLALELTISSDVEFPGFVENPFPYISRSGLLVVSSRIEGLSNVLIEALACGTPVVATDCPCGPREVLEQGRYGMLVRVGDVEALARAIEQTLDNPPDPTFLKSAAERFSVDVIAKQYLEVLIGEVREK